MKKLSNCFKKNYGKSQRFIRFSETDQSETDKIHAENAKNKIARRMDEDMETFENNLETKVNNDEHSLALP